VLHIPPKEQKITIVKEEATSVLVGFHAGPLSWLTVGFLWREENRRTRRKIPGARQEKTTNSTHNSPESKASAFTTAPSVLGKII